MLSTTASVATDLSQRAVAIRSLTVPRDQPDTDDIPTASRRARRDSRRIDWWQERTPIRCATPISAPGACAPRCERAR